MVDFNVLCLNFTSLVHLWRVHWNFIIKLTKVWFQIDLLWFYWSSFFNRRASFWKVTLIHMYNILYVHTSSKVTRCWPLGESHSYWFSKCSPVFKGWNRTCCHCGNRSLQWHLSWSSWKFQVGKDTETRRGQRGSWPVDEVEGFPKPTEEQMYSYKMQRGNKK